MAGAGSGGDDEAMLIELELAGLQSVMSGFGAVSQALAVIHKQLQAIKNMRNIAIKFTPKWDLTAIGKVQSIAPTMPVQHVFVVNWPARGYGSATRMPRLPVEQDWIKKFQTFVYSMRFGQNGLMPLVGRTLALLPPNLRIWAIVGVALGKVADAAAKSIAQFRADQLTSGGTAREAGRLRALGAAVGLDNMGAMARQLADTLATNGMAAGAGARIGIHDINNPYASDLDKARNLERVIDYITSASTSDAEARRFAILTSTEELLRLRDASRDVVFALKQQGEISGFINDKTATNEAADFQGMLALLKESFGNLVSVIGQYVMPIFTAVGSVLAGVFDLVAVLLKDLGLAVIPLIKLVMMLVRGIGDLLQMLANFFTMQWMNPDKPENKAQDRHTDAMNEHSRMLKEGMYGGGERAHGAVPSGFNGRNPSAQLNPATMGAFGL